MAPTTCELCGDPLDGQRPWQEGLDGNGAHADCLDAAMHDDEGDDDE